jgi:hypothetical protein
MKTLVFSLLLIMICNATALCQKRKVNDSLSVTFRFSELEVTDSSQLTFCIEYQNNIGKPVDIYQYLEEGDMGDRFFNISIEMEKLKEKKYYPHALRFYQNPLLYNLEDSLRHYDLPKMKLSPYSSRVLDFNLLNSAKGFLPGKYRFKVYLRVETIRDGTEYNDKNFETSPPMDKLKYINSKWFYFTVKKEIAPNLGKMEE